VRVVVVGKFGLANVGMASEHNKAGIRL